MKEGAREYLEEDGKKVFNRVFSILTIVIIFNNKFEERFDSIIAHLRGNREKEEIYTEQ